MTDTILPDGRKISGQELAAMQDEAKSVVRRMLENACIPAAKHAESSIKKAIADILEIYVQYGYIRNGRLKLVKRDQEKVDAILRDLMDKLYDLIEEYATAEADDDEDAILVYLGKEYAGHTCKERIESGAALMLGKVRDKIWDETLRDGGIVPSDIGDALMGVVGVGTLLRLVETEISRSWQFRWRIDHKDARFVHVFRGSSYNCDICDEIVGLGWQPVEHAVTPPIHPNCRCYCVYI